MTFVLFSAALTTCRRDAAEQGARSPSIWEPKPGTGGGRVCVCVCVCVDRRSVESSSGWSISRLVDNNVVDGLVVRVHSL